MLTKDLLNACRKHTMLLVFLIVLSGCLPTAEPDTPDEIVVGDPGSDATVHRVSGSVGDGPITDAQIRVTARDGRNLVTTSSSATASYDISVETESADYPLLIIATGGTDLVTLTSPDFDMQSVVKNPGESSVANLNPFTTIAIELASDLQGGVTAANIDSALQIVVRELNSGLNNLTGSAVLQSAVSGSNIAELVRASEALGELVRRTRDALSAAGQIETGNSIVAALGSDLVDGKLDGRGGPRANARIAAVAGVLRAQIALETMQNQLRVQGTDAAGRMATAMGQVFSGSINPSLADLRATADQISALQVGTIAVHALQPSTDFENLLAESAAISAGMSSAQVRQAVSGEARSAFDTGVVAIATASAVEIDLINEVLRSGSVPDGNSAPTISGTPATTVSVGATYNFLPSASDTDGDALTFSISGKPAWAAFNSSTGRLRGVPQEADAGSYQGIVISVSDGLETASLPAFTLTVRAIAGNTPPTISGNPATEAQVGQAYLFQPSAADVDGDQLSFSISNRPAWASFDAATGALSGTPSAASVRVWPNIVITVSDGEDTASLAAFTFNVSDIVTANTPPAISGNPATEINVGQAYSFQPAASDADGDALSFSISNRPAWAAFDTATGVLTGTPAAAHVGAWSNIVITVSDGEDAASLSPFTINVNDVVVNNTPPTISGNPASQVVANSPYTFTPQANDADGDNLTFSVQGLPSWATFDSANGRISGTPAESDAATYSGIRIT
ncbi:MAG: putative Ig domain-containing protein, partial [Woeseia sp.]